jgi:hypothetical protein
MVRKIKNRTNKRGNSNSSKQYQQQRLDLFPSEFQIEQTKEGKQIVINSLESVTKYDQIVLTVEFKLVPSKTVFSKLRSTLWFDDQEFKTDLLTVPQSLGGTDEFQLSYTLDMRGISAGVHSVKAELCDVFYPCTAIKEQRIDYVPLDRKAAYRKIPIAKKVAGEDFTIVSSSDKQIYTDIGKARKNELDSKRDNW